MAQNLRMTHQRDSILRELRHNLTHPTADELYESIRRTLPRISLATVYRNLETLAAKGLIKKIETSGRQKRFDGELHEHHHILCIRCHRVENLPTLDVTLPSADPEASRGYRITGCRIEFFGLCPTCQHNTATIDQQGGETMGCATCGNTALSDAQRRVLDALAKSQEPCGSKELAAATGLEAKQISCQITALKNKGYVASPVRCKYSITDEGKSVLD